MRCFVISVLKAEDRNTYAIVIDNTTYAPVLACVYESGCDDPMATANRLVTTGVHGFWTPCAVDEDWLWITITDVTHEKWRVFLELSIELLK